MSAPAGQGRTIEAEVRDLGIEGDGRVETPSGSVYVPYTMPGDRVRFRVEGNRAVDVERVADGAGRVAPVCPHFGRCGGCALQHVGPAAYAAWKRARVARALSTEGLEIPVAAPFVVGLGTRRRVRLAARAAGGGVALGFRARRSHRIVGIETCPIAVPEIVALLPSLSAALARCLGRRAALEITVSAVEGAIDVAAEDGGPVDLETATALADLAEQADLARVTWSGEPVVSRRAVRMTVGEVAVDLPPGAFLQPTAPGEARLRALAAEALGNARRVADLFAGCGALGLAMLDGSRRITAYESKAEQTASIAVAAARSGVADIVRAETMDLHRRPLAAPELAGFDGVILDPPRAGAREQVRCLAESDVPVVAYASCNPVSFARDARILVEAGYRCGEVVPIDQFLYSAEVELFAAFVRD